MAEVSNVLQLRVLLTFLKDDSETCTITGIARTLGEEKYTVSRVTAALEKEGFLDRSNSRRPKLTEAGREAAELYQERINVTMSHLTYEGVDIESAKKDAYHWALHNTEQTMEVLRSAEEQYRVKYELRDQRLFGGRAVCERLRDGYYTFPFLLYREHVENGSNLAGENEWFEHPCTLYVKDGKGTVQLRALNHVIPGGNGRARTWGRIRNVKYFDAGNFVGADITGTVWSFPMEVLQFVNIGSGIGQLLHGSVSLKLTTTVGAEAPTETMVIFTMIV